MASMNVKQETIERPLDECACDWCHSPLLCGARVLVDLEQGTAYCSLVCADLDRAQGQRDWTVEERLAREG
jgi:hypothetical protein